MKQQKIIVYILLLIIVNIQLKAQVWPKYYIKENTSSFSDGIIETYDGGFMISGNYYTYDGTDFKQWSWLIKTDINGNILWDKVIEGGDEYVRTNITQTIEGGILTCGAIWSATGQWEPYVMKLNSCGEKEWCKVFTGSVNENPWAEDILEFEDNQIYVLVNQWATSTIEDMFVFKLSAGGDVLWKKSFCNAIEHPESNIAIGESIIKTSNNKILISGRVYWADPWNPGGPKPIRSLFVSIDSLGNEEWVLPFGLEDSIHGNGTNVFEQNKNSYIGLATKWPTSTMQSVLINFDSLGTILDYIIIENDQINSEITRGVPLNLERIDSVYLLGGIYGNPEVGYSSEIVMDTNFFTNFFVNGFFQHIYEDYPYTMIKAGNKFLSNSTYTNSEYWKIVLSKMNLNLEYDTLDPGNYNYDSLCTTPGLPQSGFIYLDECDIITGTEIPSPEEYYSFIARIPITAYPNPAETEITLAFENSEHHNNMLLECYNIYGQKLHSEKIYKGQQQTKLDVSNWGKGLYFAVVKSNGKVAGTGRFVRR
jgi:hypothetical protein